MEKFEGVCLHEAVLLTAHVCRLASAREQTDCGGATDWGASRKRPTSNPMSDSVRFKNEPSGQRLHDLTPCEPPPSDHGAKGMSQEEEGWHRGARVCLRHSGVNRHAVERFTPQTRSKMDAVSPFPHSA